MIEPTKPIEPIEPTDATEHAVGTEDSTRTEDPPRTGDPVPAQPLEIPPTVKPARLFDAPAQPLAADEGGDVSEAEVEGVGVGVGEVNAETGGQEGPDPTRYGDWEKKGRCIDF